MSEDILYLAYVRGFLESCICQRMFISCICQRIYLFQHILHLRCQRITCILHLRCQRIFFIFTWHLFSLYSLNLPWAYFQPLFPLPSASFQPLFVLSFMGTFSALICFIFDRFQSRFVLSSLASFQSNSSYHN